MADTIGRITVPTTTLSTGGAGLSGTQVFPLTTQPPFGFSVARPVITHRFGSLDAKQEQRYFVGIGPRSFRFVRPNLGWTEARELRSFWESMQGPWQAFTYNVPNADGTTTPTLVTFQQTPLSLEDLRNYCQAGLNFIEVVDPTQAPTYNVSSTCLRFPSSALTAALLSETQQIIPLIHIRVREAAVPDIWLSDRRVTLTDAASGAVAAAMGWSASSQLYLPRVTGIGEQGSDVLISQDIKGSSDNVKFTFGNADRVMTQLSNDTDLMYAAIDFCALHVNSGIVIQIWKGVLRTYTSDGTPNFPVACSDGFFQIMNQYPERQASRMCWKQYNDGVYCPFATQGSLQTSGESTAGVAFQYNNSSGATVSGGDPNSCDYYLESANGCQAHGMTPYFGGQQADPQGVTIKDDSTGFIGFGRNVVTATSIISETIWGLALPEIWCNSGGNPLYAFMATALMVAYRDESTYADSLGILGAGPLGGFTQSAVVATADGFRYVVAPMVDGYTWQGFKVNGNLNITKNQPGMGLRQVAGNDPVNPTTDYFSLGAGTPQVWEPNNYAAGIALCELRITKSSTIQPSTPDQHQMTIPIDYGLTGYAWDHNGNRTSVMGLVNPFWVVINMLMRACNLAHCIPPPINPQSIVVTLPPSSFFSFAGSTVGTFVGIGLLVAGYALFDPEALIAGLVMLIGSAFVGNEFSVPMSNAANQAATLLQQNLSAWQALAPVYQTTTNQALFIANFNTVWNAYVQACVVIAGPNPTGNAELALIASVQDRMPVGMTSTVGSITFHGDGKYDWFAYYLTPIQNSPLPGNTLPAIDNPAAQLQMFVLSSLTNAAGTGAADLAALQVAPVLGGGGTTYAVTSAGELVGVSPMVVVDTSGNATFQYTNSSGNLVTVPISLALTNGWVSATSGTTETQFQFQGTIGSQKPFRDWVTEVLNCCLGFYTWEFGALKLGIRVNASAVDAYTVANRLYQSLKLTPVTAAFEHLVISYADVAYQFQANTAEYCDKSLAAYYGRQGAPLTSQMHSVGISTLSQALRVAATRTREEVGGVTPMEWRNARTASWLTTLLGLGNEVGQVVSMTDPDIPGARGVCNVAGATATWVSGDAWTYAGTPSGDTELIDKVILIGGEQVTITAVASDGSTITTSPAPPSGTGLAFHVITMCFRIERWALKKDWSVEIQGRTVTTSMYDLVVGPKPVDVAPAPPPPIFYPIPFGPAWAPYQIQAAANDALFPGEWTFDSDQEYSTLSDGSQQALMLITGKLPVTQFSPTGAGAPAIGSIAQSSTGGSVPPCATLYLSICALDANGLPSAPSNIAVLGTGILGTDSFTLNDITWPAITGLASFVLFIGVEDDLICEQMTGELTPTGGGTTYGPASISFNGPVARSTWALPTPYVSRVRVKAKLLVHSGVAGLAVTGVAVNIVICSGLVDPGGTFTPVGRILSCVGRPNAPTPFASFNITAFDNTTGAMTLDRDPSTIVLVGDAVVIRNVGTSLTANPTLVSSVTDTGYQNIANGYGGMTPGAEVGNLIRIIKGTGRNQPPSTITANTATQLTFQPPLLMDITTIWIVEGPTWAYQSDSSAAGNAVPTTPVTISVPTQNFILQPMLIAGFTVDVNGNESPDDGSAPVREDWIYGSLGTVTVSQSMTQLASHCTVQFDTSHVTGATSQLNAGIAAGATALVLNSNYTEPNGTYLTVDSESFLVTAGTGTPNLTVVPGQLGTTQALHAANASVSIPGCLVFTLQRPGQVPNQNFYGHKNSPDINYVKVISPSGAYWLLTDMSPARGTLYLKAPAQ